MDLDKPVLGHKNDGRHPLQSTGHFSAFNCGYQGMEGPGGTLRPRQRLCKAAVGPDPTGIVVSVPSPSLPGLTPADITDICAQQGRTWPYIHGGCPPPPPIEFTLAYHNVLSGA